MVYDIIFSDNARDDFYILSPSIKQRIKDKLHSVQENPLHYFERLKGRNDYKLRVGDYRVIANINLTLKRIEVTTLGHRKNIYNLLP